ncbi:MAG TPA: P-loop NTPase [Acidimicrobiales bacterium]|nr:P-loop NTPase [Acidimicrobiales bacterium]
MASPPSGETADTRFRHYVHVLRRGRWLLAPTVVTVLGAVAVFTLRQERLYEASATVLINRASVAAVVAGTQGFTAQDFPRVLQTKADLAHSFPVAARTLEASGLPGRNPTSFLERSSAEPRPQADLLQLSVRDPEPTVAKQLAGTFADEFVAYQHELESDALQAARTAVEQRLAETSGDTALSNALQARIDQLTEIEALTTSLGQVVAYPTRAEQVQPKPLRNAMVGGAMGLLLGVGLVFLYDALDPRLRSSDEVGALLGLPLLGRLPSPPSDLDPNVPVLREHPHSSFAEAYRMLALSIEFLVSDTKLTVLAVTSALEGEGKSTTVANLGLALAEAGKSVVIVDLDLRRPTIATFFGGEDRSGVTDFLAARGEVSDVVTLVPLRGSGEDGERGVDSQTSPRGSLRVIGAGTRTAEPSLLLRHPRLAKLVDYLRESVDVVLLDTPPLLRVSDPGSVAQLADGAIFVAKLGVVRRPMLREVQRVVQRYPTEALGFVLTNAEREQSPYYEGSYYRGDYLQNGDATDDARETKGLFDTVEE